MRKSKSKKVQKIEVVEEPDDVIDSDESVDDDDSWLLTEEDIAAKDNLPATVGEVIPSTLSAPGSAQSDSLKSYIQSIMHYPLLSLEEEKVLTKELIETGDIEIAKKLVLANLRLVVKIAMEYRHSYQNILDLIQEGNIGLMKAVSKFNPESGTKLSYYASWWIRSYILKFILDNFRLVKIGTTHDQKKLFYNLMREKDRLAAQGIEPQAKLIAQNLHVSEKSVLEMDKRLSASGAEVSIDKAQFDESGASFHDILADESEDIPDKLAFTQGLEILRDNLKQFLDRLKPRDREVFEKRLLAEVPTSLQAIADQYGVSRERIRQVEARLLEQLKVYMGEYLR